ncbi:MAG: hypothetical protein IKB73_07820 [Ruminococcus sp.]|nr:hypothetical protein [Ruminococcus sp.]
MQSKQKKNKLTVFEMTLFSMFSAMMFISKIVMEFLPNIHLLAMFTVLLTVVYRKKALIPIYIFVLITGVYAGFAMWWVPYTYVWTVLWAAAMLIPKNLSKIVQIITYSLLCGLHGFLYGTLYAPAQALMFSLSFEQMIAWIVAGLAFDMMHGIGNIVAGLLVYPLSKVLIKLNSRFIN